MPSSNSYVSFLGDRCRVLGRSGDSLHLLRPDGEKVFVLESSTN